MFFFFFFKDLDKEEMQYHSRVLIMCVHPGHAEPQNWFKPGVVCWSGVVLYSII